MSKLCDRWIDISDHGCRNKWRHEIKLEVPTKVIRGPMMGTYPIGVWRFCDMHFKIFNRDKEEV